MRHNHARETTWPTGNEASHSDREYDPVRQAARGEAGAPVTLNVGSSDSEVDVRGQKMRVAQLSLLKSIDLSR